MRLRHVERSSADASQELTWMEKSFSAAEGGVWPRFFWPPTETFSMKKFHLDAVVWHAVDVTCPSDLCLRTRM